MNFNFDDNPLSTLVAVSHIYSQNKTTFQNYPNSILQQLKAYINPNHVIFKELITLFEKFQQKSDALCKLDLCNSYLSVLNHKGVQSYWFTTFVNSLIYIRQYKVLAVLSENLYFIDENLKLLRTIEFSNAYAFMKIYIKISKHHNTDDFLHTCGGIVAYHDTDIVSMKLNGQIIFEKCCKNQIKDLKLINESEFILLEDSCSYFKTVDVNTGAKIRKYKLNCIIKRVFTNINEDEAFYSLHNNNENVIVLVVLEDESIRIYKYSSQLMLIGDIPSCDNSHLLEINRCCLIPSYSSNSLIEFVISDKLGEICKYSIDNNYRLTTERYTELCTKLEWRFISDFYDNLITIICMDCICIFDTTKNYWMKLCDGEYIWAKVLSSNKMLTANLFSSLLSLYEINYEKKSVPIELYISLSNCKNVLFLNDCLMVVICIDRSIKYVDITNYSNINLEADKQQIFHDEDLICSFGTNRILSKLKNKKKLVLCDICSGEIIVELKKKHFKNLFQMTSSSKMFVLLCKYTGNKNERGIKTVLYVYKSNQEEDSNVWFRKIDKIYCEFDEKSDLFNANYYEKELLLQIYSLTDNTIKFFTYFDDQNMTKETKEVDLSELGIDRLDEEMDNILVTNNSKHIFIYTQKQLFYLIDIDKKLLIHKHKLSSELVLLEFKTVDHSDDIICHNYTDEKMFLITISTNSNDSIDFKIIENKKRKINFIFDISDDLVTICSTNLEKLFVYDIEKVKRANAFKYPIFEYSTLDLIRDFQISENKQYITLLIDKEGSSVMLFRLQTKQCVAHVPIINYAAVNIATFQQYLAICLDNSTLITFKNTDNSE